MIIKPEQNEEQMKLADLIKELPPGAIQTWGQLEHTTQSSTTPVYLFILNIAADNPMLQFKHPKLHLQVLPDALFYSVTNERVAQQKFFNRNFLPTFFVFDNYMHVLGFENRLKAVGYTVQKRQFE